MDTIRKKLEVCLAEKENLERQVDDLKAKFEQVKSQTSETTTEGREQIDPPPMTDMPVINDQLQLKTLVDAIAAASHREAEAHETTIFLSKENEELRVKLKALIEDNNKLIELYEQATAEHNRTQEIGSKVDNGYYLEKREEEAVLKKEIENLQHQLVEINEENKRLMSLYERAIQEKDDLKRTLSCSGHERVEPKGELDCVEKFVEVDGGEIDLRVGTISEETQQIGDGRYDDKPAIFESDLCLESNGHDDEASLIACSSGLFGIPVFILSASLQSSLQAL